MKDSGYKWLGQIPNDWEISRVGKFFEIQLGKMLQPNKEFSDDSYENYLCAANVGKNQLKLDSLKQMWFSKRDKEVFNVCKGDLLVVEGGDVASCAIIKEEVDNLYIQNALHRVRANEGFEIRLLKYLLMVAKATGHIDLICNKATIAHFTKEKFSSIPFPFPPFSQQQKIADFLDSKCSQIQGAINDTKQTIEEYKKLKQAVITKAVTKGLKENRRMKDSGIEWIGEIPEEWEESLIGQLYDIRNTKVSDTEYPPLSVTMQGILPQLKNVAKSDAHDDRKLVMKGDLAINSRSDRRGSSGISDYDGSVSLINIVLIPRNKMNSKYYNWLFHTERFEDEFYKWGHGIVDDLWTTRWQDMKNIDLPVPPKEEQEKIVDYLDKKCSQIDNLIQQKEQFITELEKYKQSLIYEYVTGKKEVK